MVIHMKPQIEMNSALSLLSKQPSHPLEYTILFRVIWVVLARDLKNGRESLGVGIDAVPDTLCNLYPIVSGRMKALK